MSCALPSGLYRDFRRSVAALTDSMTMFRCTEDNLELSVQYEHTDAGYTEGHIASGMLTSGSKIVLRVDGFHSLIFEEVDKSSEWGDSSGNIPMTARAELVRILTLWIITV